MKLDKESLSALIKLLTFLGVTGMATFLLIAIIGNFTFQSSNEYQAEFTDVTGVAKGDDVRIAGVKVGSVKGIRIVDRDKAVVTFSVVKSSALTTDTNAQIRYRNLVGQRYIVLMQGADGGSSPLRAGATIPLERTQEALDLNVLLNGFKPVFEALSPEDTNKLAFEIVKTFQGESGNVEQLLASTSSLTRTLADRDQLIGDVVTNLSDTLDIVGSRDRQLTDTIDTLQQFVTGLKQDRGAILGSLDSISSLTDETSSLLIDARPDLASDVKELKRLTGTLSQPKNVKTVDTTLKILPRKLEKLSNLASNGSLFNFYVCSLQLSGETGIAGLDQLLAQLQGALGLDTLKAGGPRCGDRGVQ